jgi:hypothetical protein
VCDIAECEGERERHACRTAPRLLEHDRADVDHRDVPCGCDLLSLRACIITAATPDLKRGHARCERGRRTDLPLRRLHAGGGVLEVERTEQDGMVHVRDLIDCGERTAGGGVWCRSLRVRHDTPLPSDSVAAARCYGCVPWGGSLRQDRRPGKRQ